MELKECITCGSHAFTDNKCDYCGNQYKAIDDDRVEEICDDGAEEYIQDFKETPDGKILLKIMIITLVSIIWFAVTVFIPPLFIITIILLVFYSTYCLIKRSK